MKPIDSNSTSDIRSRIRSLIGGSTRERPLDNAQACVSYLAAIDQLLSAANQNDLHTVKASDLGMLLTHIREELDDALTALAQEPQPSRPPRLRPI